MIRKKTSTAKILFIVLALLTAIALAAFYSELVIKRYEISSEEVESPLSLVLITDTHSLVTGKDLKKLTEDIKKKNPKVIFLVGDIADDDEPVLGTELFLEGIKDICPIFYVTGNHEYWADDFESIWETIESYGVTILRDEYVETEIDGTKFVIAGIEDPSKKTHEDKTYSQETSMGKAFSELKDIDGYKILLAHRPELIETYKKYSFDLVLSGHTHGGQGRIPFILNGLWAPDQGWFPKYGGGLYKHGTLTHIISRGASNNPRLPRVFNPPELVVVELEPVTEGIRIIK